MSKKSRPKSGWIMLGITVILYIFAAFFEPSKAMLSLEKSFDILKMIAPILIIVLLVMALINTFIKPKSVVKHLGEESGIKGWFIAITGGVISHGSTYIWYPILSELRDNGAKNGLIVAFFYARSIKLPWIPVMISYFGLSFTLLLSIYILLGAWIQGVIADRLITQKSIKGSEI